MGLLKELREKLEAGTITEEEKKTLQELEKDIEETPTPDSNTDEEDDDEQAVEDLAEKLASATMDKIEARTKDVKPSPKVEVTSEAKFIVDPQLGKVSVKELDEVKVDVPGRKESGKKYTSVSMKTIHTLQAIFTGNKEKLQILVEGTGALGGFLVPEDFVNILVEDRRDRTVMRDLATVIPVSTDTIHIPNLANRPQAQWRSEAAVKATTTVEFGETVLTPYSLAAIVPLTNELVADASLGGNIVSIVARVMSTALAEKEDRAFWTGDGSGKPTGIDNYSFLTVNAGAGANDSQRADAIIRSIYQLPQGYRANAAFVANKNTWAKVATLKDSQNNYLLSDLGNAASPTLRGLRTYEQNDLPDGKAFVGDFSDYYIADRQGISVDTSGEATVGGSSAFEKNLTFVRVEERVDGELTLTKGIVELQGLGGF
jgi:HK97 family phage major capsid protein